MTEEITEKIFQGSRKIERGKSNHSDSNNCDSFIPQIAWKAMNSYIKANPETSGISSSKTKQRPG